MNPGTFYLYEYEGDLRKRNAGFLKISRHYQSCIFQIHLRSSQLETASEIELYGFFFHENTIQAQRLSVLSLAAPTEAFHFCASENSFPQRRSLEAIDGFFLKCPVSSVFWFTPDCPETIEFNKICFLDTVSTLQDKTQTERSEDARQKTQTERSNEARHEIQSETSDEARHEIQSETSNEVRHEAQTETSADVPSETTLETQAAAQQYVTDEKTEKSLPDEPSFPRKISLSELTILPRRFWSLSSNSFLLHGYHNYKHLILAEQNNRLWLGVPGVYDLREARAADLFGFPRFCRSYADSEMLSDEERNLKADFGHWFRCVGSFTK